MIVFAKTTCSSTPLLAPRLICCRNLLIYLDLFGTGAVFDMFPALKPGGYLFLAARVRGPALADFETVSRTPISACATIRCRQRTRLPPRRSTWTSSRMWGGGRANDALPPWWMTRSPRCMRVPEPRAPPRVLSTRHQIEHVSEGAGRFVAFGQGVPSRNLLNNVAVDIRVELRTALYRASSSGTSIQAVFHREDAGESGPGRTLALSVHPVPAGELTGEHWLVMFDETPAADPQIDRPRIRMTPPVAAAALRTRTACSSCICRTRWAARRVSTESSSPNENCRP